MRKIIIQEALGANHYIRQSLVNAFRHAGYEVYFWNDTGKSPFDLFQEIDSIDLFIGSTWQLTRALIKCLIKSPNTKVVLYGDIWGEIQNDLDLNKYPVGIAEYEHKKNVENLFLGRGSKQLNIVSNHSDASFTHGYWSSIGCTVDSLLVSADITQYYPRPSDENYKVALGYVGGYWAYKSRNIDQYLLPLLYPNTNWPVRIFGGGWNVPQYVGQAGEDEIAKYYSNAMIIPHLVEPHASDIYGDVPLRYMQVAACKGFAISCPCVSIRNIFAEPELVVADNPSDFFDKVTYYLNHPEETLNYRLNAYCKVVGGHTGFHRCREIFQMIGEDTTSLDNKIYEIHQSVCGECYG